MTSVAGSSRSARTAALVIRPPTSADRSRPPTPMTWLAPTPQRSSRRHGLLGAGARCRDDSDRPRPDDVGEAEADTAEHRCPGAGAHQQAAPGECVVLEGDLLLDGTLSLNNSTCKSADRAWNSRQGGVVAGTEITATLESGWARTASRNEARGVGTTGIVWLEPWRR